MSEVVALVGDIGQVACAATVHKSQGSEYPAVVIPVLTQHYPMLPRNLLYTGVARGKQLVVLMASPGFRVAHGVAGYPPSLSSPGCVFHFTEVRRYARVELSADRGRTQRGADAGEPGQLETLLPPNR